MAANDLINVYDPTFWAQETLMQVFPQLRMAALVYRDFENIIAESGDTVNTRMPNKFTARTVDPDNFASNKPKADNVQVKLDTWKEVTFEIGDKEASLSMKDLLSEFMVPAATAIVEVIEDAITALHTDFYNFTGVAGVTPADVAALGTNIKEKFDTLYIPDSPRQVVLGPAAVNKFNQVFYQDYVSGSPDQQMTGSLRPKFGMQYTDSNKLPRHTNGLGWVGSTPLINNGAGYAANAETNGALPGISTIAIDGLAAGTPTLLKGDLFTLDHGGSIGVKPYTLTADANVAANAATITVSPGLQAAVVDNQALTVIASHAVNLAFHKQALALVSRPMRVPTAPGANVSVVNFGGIGLRASVWYEPKDVRTYVRMDGLFGVKTLDARKGFRVLG